MGTFSTNLFIQGCTLLQGILLARLLGPAGRGEFAAVVSWPSVFAGLGIFGANMAIARFDGQGWSTESLAKTAVRSSLLTGLATVLVCGFFLPVLLPASKQDLLPAACLFLLFIPINHLGLNLQAIDHGAGNFGWLNSTRALIYPIFFLGIALSWWFATDKLLGVTASLLVANGSIVFLRLSVKIRSFKSVRQGIGARRLIKASLPFVAANVIAILYMQMDKALLVWLLMPEEIGWYVAAFAAAGSVNVLSSALGIVQFSSAAQSQPGYGFHHIATNLRRGFIMSVFAGGALAFFLPWLLPLIYGEDFASSTQIAYILLPGLVLAGLGEIVNQALRGQGQPIVGVISRIFGLTVMGLAGILLARRWGASGIACGYLAGELVAFVGLIWIAIRYYKDAKFCELYPKMTDIAFLWSKLFRLKEVLGK